MFFYSQADREELGKLLLDGAKLSNRKVMALIIRTEERELLSDCVRLIDDLTEQLNSLGDSYVPPDVVAV